MFVILGWRVLFQAALFQICCLLLFVVTYRNPQTPGLSPPAARCCLMLQQVALLAPKAPGGFFSPGLDLINISLQADSQDVLRLLLPKDAMESAPPPPLSRQQQQELWFEACKACQHKDLEPVRRFFAAGGTPRHRVCQRLLPLQSQLPLCCPPTDRQIDR
jgi:hypothetical protein